MKKKKKLVEHIQQLRRGSRTSPHRNKRKYKRKAKNAKEQQAN